MTPEFIYFDLGNVLLNFDRDQQFQQLADAAGVSLEAAREATDEPINLEVETGRMSTAELYVHFCQVTNSRPPFEDFAQAYNDIFVPNAEIRPLLAKLKETGIRMAILSNTSELHWNFVFELDPELFTYFGERPICSYEVGAMKPDPQVFDAAIKLAGVPAEKILFMDDRQENVDGAIESGIDAVLFTDAEQLRADLKERGIEC